MTPRRPPGADPWVVAGAGPGTGIDVTGPAPAGRGTTTASPAGSGRPWAGGCCSWSTWGPPRARDWRPSPSSTSTLPGPAPRRERGYLPALETGRVGLGGPEPPGHRPRLAGGGRAAPPPPRPG